MLDTQPSHKESGMFSVAMSVFQFIKSTLGLSDKKQSIFHL